jgi:hypothetical protein
LNLLLDNVGDGKRFVKLTNARLREFGAQLKFHPGIPELFTELKDAVQQHQLSSPGIQFYVVSGGLEEIIRGSSITKYLSGVWGCQFAEENGEIRHIKKLVSFTEKTKYLFYINKGLGPNAGAYAVNEKIDPKNRRVPFENMIYLGDALTDVPCFSLVEGNEGRAFGVFNPENPDSPKKAWEKLVAPKRVTTMNAPKYGPTDELGALLRAHVQSLCFRLDGRTGAVRE